MTSLDMLTQLATRLADVQPRSCPECDGHGRIPNGHGTGDCGGGWADTCEDCHGSGSQTVVLLTQEEAQALLDDAQVLRSCNTRLDHEAAYLRAQVSSWATDTRVPATLRGQMLATLRTIDGPPTDDTLTYCATHGFQERADSYDRNQRGIPCSVCAMAESEQREQAALVAQQQREQV